MDDSTFLQWVHDRLVHVHGENELYDYMHRLRSIIEKLKPSPEYDVNYRKETRFKQ